MVFGNESNKSELLSEQNISSYKPVCGAYVLAPKEEGIYIYIYIYIYTGDA
jgi:hypothetical protein